MGERGGTERATHLIGRLAHVKDDVADSHHFPPEVPSKHLGARKVVSRVVMVGSG